MDSETPWEAFDAEVYFPFHLLAIVSMLFILLIFILRFWIDRVGIDVNTPVHSRDEVIDDLHHFCCVSTQVQALHWSRVDIPVKGFEVLLRSSFDDVEDEVEAQAALAALRCVLMRL